VKICLVDETGAGDGALSVLAARWELEHDEENLMALVMTPEHLELRKRDEPKLGGIFVDFVGGAMAHRRKFGGGRGEAVAKAVGIKGSYLPDVVDATAGLGRDASLVKKEMRVFQSLVGPDLDADGLLEPACQLATKRVVVKRPDYAPPLADVATTNAVTTKGHRFDIYSGTPE